MVVRCRIKQETLLNRGLHVAPATLRPTAAASISEAPSRYGCGLTCDFWCSYNWRVELDGSGCEIWRYDTRQPLPGRKFDMHSRSRRRSGGCSAGPKLSTMAALRPLAPALLATWMLACGGQVSQGPNPPCEQTHETISFALDSFGSPMCGSSAGGSSSPLKQVFGRVTAVSPRELQLDTCLPCTDCASLSSTLSIDSVSLPALDSIFVPDTLVHLLASADPFTCAMTLSVRNEPDWCGIPNPIATDTRLYLALGDGALTPDPMPVSVTKVPLGCLPSTSPVCGGPQNADSYELDFKNTDSGQVVRVPMGHTATLDADNGGQWQVRNLRSYQTSYCDDYYNWADWIARVK